MGKLKRFQKHRQAARTANAQTLEKGVGPCVAAGQRGGMGHSCRLGLLRNARFQGNQGDPLAAGFLGQSLPPAQIAKPFNVQPNRRYALIVQQLQRDVGLGGLRLVATGEHIANWQAAVLHREVNGDIGALGQNRHTPLHPAAPMLIRPNRAAIKSIHKPIAIGPEDWHLSGGLNQRGLKVLRRGVFSGRFGEARGKTDGTTGL